MTIRAERKTTSDYSQYFRQKTYVLYACYIYIYIAYLCKVEQCVLRFYSMQALLPFRSLHQRPCASSLSPTKRALFDICWSVRIPRHMQGFLDSIRQEIVVHALLILLYHIVFQLKLLNLSTDLVMSMISFNMVRSNQN